MFPIAQSRVILLAQSIHYCLMHLSMYDPPHEPRGWCVTCLMCVGFYYTMTHICGKTMTNFRLPMTVPRSKIMTHQLLILTVILTHIRHGRNDTERVFPDLRSGSNLISRHEHSFVVAIPFPHLHRARHNVFCFLVDIYDRSTGWWCRALP